MKSRPKLQYIVLTILLVWAFTAQLTYSGYRIYLLVSAPHRIELPFRTAEWTRRIVRIHSAYANTGLAIGDEVLALNGQPLTGAKQMEELQLSMHPAEVLNVAVRRTVAGHNEILTIPERMRPPVVSSIDWLNAVLLSTVFPLSCLLVGFYIAFARPGDPLAWITFGMLASFGQLAGSGFSWAIWSPVREMLIAYHGLLVLTWPVLMVLFAIYFPVPYPFVQRHRWINWLLALPCL